MLISDWSSDVCSSDLSILSTATDRRPLNISSPVSNSKRVKLDRICCSRWTRQHAQMCQAFQSTRSEQLRSKRSVFRSMTLHLPEPGRTSGDCRPCRWPKSKLLLVAAQSRSEARREGKDGV